MQHKYLELYNETITQAIRSETLITGDYQKLLIALVEEERVDAEQVNPQTAFEEAGRLYRAGEGGSCSHAVLHLTSNSNGWD